MVYRAATERQHGFTLLEMIVVLAVLALCVGLIVSHGPARSARLESDAVARDIADTLRLERSHAIAQNRVIHVAVGIHGYQAGDRVARTLPSRFVLAGTSLISFAPDGSSSGGQIAVQDTGGGRRLGIFVDWLTGRVGVAEIK